MSSDTPRTDNKESQGGAYMNDLARQLERALTTKTAELAACRAELEACRQDAERYRYLQKRRPVMLATGFFGNGCINKTSADVDSVIDAAIKGGEPG